MEIFFKQIDRATEEAADKGTGKEVLKSEILLIETALCTQLCLEEGKDWSF